MKSIKHYLVRGLVVVGVAVLVSLPTIPALSMAIEEFYPRQDKSVEHIQEIYSKLSKYTGVDAPPLQVVDSPVLNAWTNFSSVTITTGLINALGSDDAIAEVLGHEIGHVVLGHNLLAGLYPPQLAESSADKYGVYLMMRAGYNPCKAKEGFEVFRKEYGDYVLCEAHPNNSYRIWSLDFPMCGGSE